MSQAAPDIAPFEDTYRFAAFAIIRFASFTAHALLFGTAAISLLVLRPTFQSLTGESWQPARRRMGVRLEGFVHSALVTSVVVTCAALVLQALLVAEASGGDLTGDSFSGILETSFGRWQAARFPLLAALGVLLVGRVAKDVLKGAGDGRDPIGSAWWIGWLVVGCGLLATSTLSGHSVVASPRSLAIVNDLVHLVAGAIWFTGIIILAVVLPDAWRGRDATARLRVLAPAVVRFSTVAAISIAVLAATGTLNSFLHVEAANDLVDTGYGRALAVKLILFGGILALGGVNHFVIRKRLAGALEGDADVRPVSVFRRTIAAELVLGLLLMAITGTLVGLARTKPTPEQGSSTRGATSAPRP